MNANYFNSGMSGEAPRVMETVLAGILALSVVVVLGIAWVLPGMAEPPPPRVFTEAQVVAIKQELAEWYPVEKRRGGSETQRRKAVAKKYQDSIPELMALFPLIEKDNEKTALLEIICHDKGSRRDVIEFLGKTLTRNVDALQGGDWIVFTLDYLDHWNVPGAVRAASGLLKYNNAQSNWATDLVRRKAIRVLGKHGREACHAEVLAQFMSGLELGFAIPNNNSLYQYANWALNKINTRLANESIGTSGKNLPRLEFVHVGKGAYEWSLSVLCLSNPTPRAYSYLGYHGEDNAITVERYLRNGKWERKRDEGFCGTGLGLQELPANGSVEFYGGPEFEIGEGFSIGISLTEGSPKEIYARLKSSGKGAKQEEKELLIWSPTVTEPESDVSDCDSR